MKCAHSKGNPHQTSGRQRKNHLPSVLLLQTNLDVTVEPLLPQELLMLTQPPHHSHTSLLQTQPLTQDNRTHHQFERPTLRPCEKALRNRYLLFPVRALTGLLHYLDEIKKCQGQ